MHVCTTAEWTRILLYNTCFTAGKTFRDQHVVCVKSPPSIRILNTSIDSLVDKFEVGLKPEVNDYSRRLVEFFSSKVVGSICCDLEEKINDGSFSRFTFDMMLAWECPSSKDEEMYTESVAKEKEEHLRGSVAQDQDDVPLFYSDLMPLLVDEDRSIGEEAFVWLVSLVPLVADVANARFAFEALTAPTANRLHFPAYDRYLKEIDMCIKYLRKQTPPKGVVLSDDEFILHVEGTASTQRVIRHIGGTSWPGRLTLTNYALYFEASGVISYENALKIDLSRKDVDHKVSPTLTGPWGAPLFDKAMTYESSQLSECVVLEFPEMTSSTRRDHWLSITKEVILLHTFLSKFMFELPLQTWEMNARTILGILRLHAAREMLRISPPIPNNFLIFCLFDELPKGDYVLEELYNGLKQMNCIPPWSATYILKSLNMSHPSVSSMDVKEGFEERIGGPEEADNLTSLETAINQVREEAKEVSIAKASVEGIKEEGISDSVLVLMELLSPLKNVLAWFQGILTWKRPAVTLFILSVTMVIIYKEWIGYTIAACLVSAVGTMLWARHRRIKDRCTEIVVYTSSDQSTVESIVSAHHGLKRFKEIARMTNITILKIHSILVSKAPKHADLVMSVMIGAVALLAVVPFKFIIMVTVLYCFMMNTKIAKSMSDTEGERRMREWWNSIPLLCLIGGRM
ncbi:uncharacterized protein LOC131234037 isoform X2 [Magnolia sinica]|uniref:uncharacterized protein LOC131234037 isoform X2 n=1 Tax=Magnolia sinica TaxID=86752 RepID=UPI00265AAC4A|nr:uncharacterized protein LOC131234037 isoform X2 [Magnolia sinica]